MYTFDFGKSLVRSFERTSDDGIVVSNRDETGFVDARCQINTVIQHGMEESLEAIGIAFHDFFERGRALAAEVNAEHAADALGRESDTVLLSHSA